MSEETEVPYKTLEQYDSSQDYYEHAYLFLYRDWEKAKKLWTIMSEKGEEEKLRHLRSMIAYMEQAMKNIRDALELLAMERQLAGFAPKKERQG